MEKVLATFQEKDASLRGVLPFSDVERTMKTICGYSDETVREVVRAAGAEGYHGHVQYERLLRWIFEPHTEQKPVFYDMVHSNNAARIRLWLMLKDGVQDKIDRKIVTYQDLKEPWFAAVNPLKKVPGLVRSDGVTVFESYVILDYLEDKYGMHGPSFKPSTPEARQHMELMIRCHDIYVASPNCTAPGFSHCQGAMYLSNGFHGPARGMDLPTRAAKVGELWAQLTWLNDQIVGPYSLGPWLTLADFTWFPTTIFMEFMLPRVFGWPHIFRETTGPFPAIAAWWLKVSELPAFASVRQEIYGFWEEKEAQGQFKHIIDEIASDTSGLKFKYP